MILANSMAVLTLRRLKTGELQTLGQPGPLHETLSQKRNKKRTVDLLMNFLHLLFGTPHCCVSESLTLKIFEEPLLLVS